MYLLLSNVSCTWNVHWTLCVPSLCSTVTARPAPQFSPFRRLDEDVHDNMVLQYSETSYQNNNDGLRQIHRSTSWKPNSRSELLLQQKTKQKKTVIRTEDLATDQSRTSCSTSCQMCGTRSPWRPGPEVQIHPRNFIWNIFFFSFFLRGYKLTPLVCKGATRVNQWHVTTILCLIKNGSQNTRPTFVVRTLGPVRPFLLLLASQPHPHMSTREHL